MNERANLIKAELKECRTRAEVEAVSDKYRDEVRAMHADAATKVYAIHILNLKAYILNDFWRRRHGR